MLTQGKPGHEIQSATLELINGLVSLVYPPGMPDVAQVSSSSLFILDFKWGHHDFKLKLLLNTVPVFF